MSNHEKEFHLVLTFSEPVEGREEDYEKWYDEVHLGDICGLPGFTAAHRFELVPSGMSLGGPAPKVNLAVYEVEGDVESAVAGLGAAMKAGEVPLSKALNSREVTTWVFRRTKSAEIVPGS